MQPRAKSVLDPGMGARGLNVKIHAKHHHRPDYQYDTQSYQNSLGNFFHAAKVTARGGKKSLNRTILMNDIVVILNPAARGEKAKSLWEKIRGLSRDSFVLTTSEAGEAREFARQAARQ